MAKPILIIKLPVEASMDNCKATENLVKGRLADEYHVLVVACIQRSAESQVQFECLNAERLPETTIEEIKEILK
jgi:hypothetical protein